MKFKATRGWPRAVPTGIGRAVRVFRTVQESRRSGSGQQRLINAAGDMSARPLKAAASPWAAHWRSGPTRDNERTGVLRSQGVLVYPPILHDDFEVLGGVGDQVDIFQRIAVDQQQIGKRALFHDAELAEIRTAFAG